MPREGEGWDHTASSFLHNLAFSRPKLYERLSETGNVHDLDAFRTAEVLADFPTDRKNKWASLLKEVKTSVTALAPLNSEGKTCPGKDGNRKFHKEEVIVIGTNGSEMSSLKCQTLPTKLNLKTAVSTDVTVDTLTTAPETLGPVAEDEMTIATFPSRRDGVNDTDHKQMVEAVNTLSSSWSFGTIHGLKTETLDSYSFDDRGVKSASYSKEPDDDIGRQPGLCGPTFVVNNKAGGPLRQPTVNNRISFDIIGSCPSGTRAAEPTEEGNPGNMISECFVEGKRDSATENMNEAKAFQYRRSQFDDRGVSASYSKEPDDDIGRQPGLCGPTFVVNNKAGGPLRQPTVNNRISFDIIGSCPSGTRAAEPTEEGNPGNMISECFVEGKRDSATENMNEAKAFQYRQSQPTDSLNISISYSTESVSLEIANKSREISLFDDLSEASDYCDGCSVDFAQSDDIEEMHARTNQFQRENKLSNTSPIHTEEFPSLSLMSESVNLFGDKKEDDHKKSSSQSVSTQRSVEEFLKSAEELERKKQLQDEHYEKCRNKSFWVSHISFHLSYSASGNGSEFSHVILSSFHLLQCEPSHLLPHVARLLFLMNGNIMSTRTSHGNSTKGRT